QFDSLLVESVSDGMVAISPEGRILYANRSFLERSGVRQEDIVGKHCREVVRESICDAGCPFAEVLETGISADRFDVEVQGRDGEAMSACINFTPLRDASGGVIGVVEVIRDITKLKELKDTLKRTDSMYRRERIKIRTILDNIPSGVYTVDQEMNLLSFNRSLERITGFRSEEVLGKKCMEVFRSDFCEAGCPLKRSMRTGETLRGIEVNLRAKDGSVVPIASSTALLRDEDGRPIGGICSFRDLREVHAVPASQGQVRDFLGMVSKNHRMHEIFDLIETVAESDANVLIEGESGTGKELVARAIHRLSGRGEKPFLGVNCASLNENLMESELFGHIRGAFTGAVKDRMGRFEMAEGGTLFLDEVSEIGPHLQAKLLRVVQEREYQRVGETRARKADVRILSATNRRLKDLLAGGSFRDDLYYRLNVVSIIPPPLRDRKEDIPVLVDFFLDRSRDHRGGLRRSFSPLAMRVLLEYSWPGNVRELENAVERARICSRGEVIEESALPAEIRRGGGTTHRGARPAGQGPDEPKAETIREALSRCRGNREEAALLLGISRVTLWRRMKRLGVSA
ncbi:sigma 54-interacting transcriptional regulator, partial [Candidatus Deferrimicrobium sp.]|uniref:sigma 54-interacting transcriptional regulator n=1 Tax=Candidatus Deferrimicrobium sp. TaxID=3060586 RepID=UPI002EDB431D